MRPVIKNRVELLKSGDVSSRALALGVLESTLREMDCYKRFLSFISFDGKILRIGGQEWDLSKKRNVYLICGGKAANAATRALETILGERLTAGVAIVKALEPEDVFQKCQVFVGGHPLPNRDGYLGCLRILELVEEACEDDLFISSVSGGTSALMSCPREGFTLEEEILTSDVCLKSGASIHEINSIRRHISRVNGGQLARSIEETGAEMILLMHRDAIGWPATIDPGEPTQVLGGPMAPDYTTLEDAKNTIRNYGLETRLPASVVAFFQNCDASHETPKELKRQTCFNVNTVPDLCLAAKKAAMDMGISTVMLTSSLSGSSKDAGTFFASLAREVHQSGNPLPAPLMMVATGEVSTIIESPEKVRGLGGPGQEMVVSFAIAARDIPGACLLSVDSDGTDGPTDAAGGIVDATTFSAAQKAGVDLYKSLRNHSTYSALDRLGCLIKTGNTGTTLCDLHILYVPECPEGWVQSFTGELPV